jgi:hypothetical protein
VNRLGSTADEVPWRFSTAAPVPGGQGGGLARRDRGVMVIGSIWLVDARDGRSTASWRAPLATRSPARLQCVIGEGERRTNLVAKW